LKLKNQIKKGELKLSQSDLKEVAFLFVDLWDKLLQITNTL